MASSVARLQGRAAVETEPAEPQDEDAQRTGSQVVAGDGVGVAVLVVLADAGAKHRSAQQSDDAADVMNMNQLGGSFGL